jgi:hypothetical protein
VLESTGRIYKQKQQSMRKEPKNYCFNYEQKKMDHQSDILIGFQLKGGVCNGKNDKCTGYCRMYEA